MEGMEGMEGNGRKEWKEIEWKIIFKLTKNIIEDIFDIAREKKTVGRKKWPGSFA